MTQASSPDKTYDRVRIILADSYPLMLLAERVCITTQQDIDIIAETRNGKEAIDLAGMLKPDVMIIGEDLLTLNGLQATRQILLKKPAPEIIVMTDRDDPEHILEIYKAGASIYLRRSCSTDQFISAIRKTYSGENVFPKDVIQLSAIDAFDDAKQINSSVLIELSPREKKLLELIALGLSNKQIASRLDIGVQYVKDSLSIMYSKLGASSRAEAMMIGLRSGIISLDNLKS